MALLHSLALLGRTRACLSGHTHACLSGHTRGLATQAASPALGFIGLGVMGGSMAANLMAAHPALPLHVYTRTPAKAHALLERGAIACDSPRQVARQADIVFSMVGLPSDVEGIYCGKEGILENLKPGAIAVDMTTSSPTLAAQLARVRSDVHFMDAPVSGGDVGARNATLTIFVGADSEARMANVLPYFSSMGKTISYFGPAGSGNHAKMANQIAIASGMVAVAEGLVYAARAGLDLEKAWSSIGAGSAGSWSWSNYGPRMLARNFDPGFFCEHFVKDLGIALEEARKMNLALPGLALASQLYQALMAQGKGERGTHSILELYEVMNSMQLPVTHVKK